MGPVAGLLGSARAPLSARRARDRTGARIRVPAGRRAYPRKTVSDTSAAPATTDFTCPRCAVEVTERFWGPCADCRRQLTETTAPARDDAAAFETARFEPAMHVTPNHVATKD